MNEHLICYGNYVCAQEEIVHLHSSFVEDCKFFNPSFFGTPLDRISIKILTAFTRDRERQEKRVIKMLENVATIHLCACVHTQVYPHTLLGTHREEKSQQSPSPQLQYSSSWTLCL